MSSPTAAMVVIGDEILSGRTRDSNLFHIATELNKLGIILKEARVISDDHDDIVVTIRDLAARYDYVFTSGGIGPTHDDITADAVAEAMGAKIGLRDDAVALLSAHYASRDLEFNEARQRMARIPEDADLIDNPVSVAPGFSLENVHVMAGVPQIFEAMLAGLLPRLQGGAPVLSQSLRVLRGEGEIASAFGDLARAYPDLMFGSYPFQQNGALGTSLVVRGQDPARLAQAMIELQNLVEK